MPKVKFLTTAAGPFGNFNAGQVGFVPDDFAAALIAGNYAVAADGKPTDEKAAALARHRATETKPPASETKPAADETTGPDSYAAELAADSARPAAYPPAEPRPLVSSQNIDHASDSRPAKKARR